MAIQYSDTFIKLLSAFLILIIGLILGQVASNIIKRLLKGLEINKVLEEQLKIKVQLERYLGGFIKYLIYFITVILVLNRIGVSTKVLQIILIIVLAIVIIFVVLAFKDWLPNLISGFYIIKSGKIKKDDIIKIKGVSGKVIQVSLLETKIETNNNEVIFIPNHNITKYELTKVKK